MTDLIKLSAALAGWPLRTLAASSLLLAQDALAQWWDPGEDRPLPAYVEYANEHGSLALFNVISTISPAAPEKVQSGSACVLDVTDSPRLSGPGVRLVRVSVYGVRLSAGPTWTMKQPSLEKTCAGIRAAPVAREVTPWASGSPATLRSVS